MTSGNASKGRMIAVYQRPCSAINGRRFLACCDLGLDLLGGEIGGDPVLDVRGIEFRLVRIDETGDDRSPNEARKPAPHGASSPACWHSPPPTPPCAGCRQDFGGTERAL